MYEEIHREQFENRKIFIEKLSLSKVEVIRPNAMQSEALLNIEKIRSEGKNKALLISATGTGKTYLSAFDVNKFKPNKFLFVVHRANIAKAAMKSYQTVFGIDKSMGMYSGSRRELDKDFVFSTIQTISKDTHLEQFTPDHFDYIVIDETHRAGADSYKRIMDYFRPKFLLGMTATPERTDGFDIFNLFNHTIAHEIRLHEALNENMLSPFHYYGVTEITVDGNNLNEDASFSLLTSSERIERVIDKAKFYGCDDGEVRGLIFCSRIDECKELSDGFNLRGYKTVALTGDNTEDQRSDAINRLESDNQEIKLDYIFTVDIFNEGVDIPRVNQVIMLRPTQSAIVFVQQLGRGLRKIENKSFLTVIDFIGNYKNNYLVPIALYGDTTYNKDSLRKLIASGSSLIPGASTVNFDKISRERIFESIDSSNMHMKRDLVKDYKLLKFKLGRIPMMVDFVEHGSRDPQLYINHSKSYYNFVESIENEVKGILNSREKKLLELFANEINNSKRVEESIIILEVVKNKHLNISSFKTFIRDTYKHDISDETIESCIGNLNFKFVTETSNGQKLTAHEIYNINIINVLDSEFVLHDSFIEYLDNKIFNNYLLDNINCAIHTYNKQYVSTNYYDGFVLYRKYSRKDVFRILNWKENPVAQNVGGYIISSDKTNCPIFVNYHKEKDISETTKYEDHFINNTEFEWMSKNRRTIDSPDVKAIINYKSGLRLPLFIKKTNDEGTDFYYMGDVTPIEGGFEQTKMPGKNNTEVSVVKVRFSMNVHVDDSLYDYITRN